MSTRDTEHDDDVMRIQSGGIIKPVDSEELMRRHNERIRNIYIYHERVNRVRDALRHTTADAAG